MSAEPGYRPFIDGNLVFLRDFRNSDVDENYQRWMSDHEVTHYIESRFTAPTRESLEAWVRKVNSDPRTMFLTMVAKDSGRNIGTVKLGPINWMHRVADLGILIGEKSYWGKGYATEAIRLMIDFCFERLNLHKVTANCYAANVGSAKAFEKVGFFIEGRRRSHCFVDGEYVDMLQLGMINPRG